MAFRKAVKFDSRLRMSISGPSGAGKTWTSLVLATALADGKGVALIDTERKSASKYADVFEFDTLELDMYHPDKFIAGIKEAEQAGYAVLIIDSLSHAWNGTGGLLEIVEAITKRSQSKNSFTAWAEATPIQNRLIDAITRSNMHIICTMRSKQEYALETVNGKTVPKKVGMAPIQRDGLEYEFDVAVDMDVDNTMIVQKSRCPALSGKVIAKPDGQVADILKSWLHGEPAPELPVIVPQAPQNGNGHITPLQSSSNGRTPSQPLQHENEAQSPAVLKMIAQAKARAEAIGIDWEALKQEALGERVADSQLVMAHFAKINGMLTTKERGQKIA